jgi:zinc D-Ala-D-Ala dipeptidase
MTRGITGGSIKNSSGNPIMHYREILIQECGEPLVDLPAEISRIAPHPYAALGAPYGNASPFMVRAGILEKLRQAENSLHTMDAGCRLQIFDAYRPVAVQQFMVDWTFQQQLSLHNLKVTDLTPEQHRKILETVYQFWAVPSNDPATPPPHSTGAAVDLTLIDLEGNPLDMGSEIDEISERSYPDYFSAINHHFHRNRTILKTAMISAGFNQHDREWWHFSYGDQLWAFDQKQPTAIYGGWPSSVSKIP